MLAREDPDLQNLASRIHTLYFLASPHKGSDFAKTFSNIINVSFGEKPFIAELSRSSQSIALINESFRKCAGNLQLWSFYETNPTRLVLTQALIVDKASATLDLPNERSYPLNADHRGICRFLGPKDPNYKTLRNTFITTIDKISSNSNPAPSQVSISWLTCNRFEIFKTPA